MPSANARIEPQAGVLGAGWAVNRLALGLLAVNALVAGLGMATLAGLAVWPGVQAGLQAPGLAALAPEALRLAGAATLAGAALGLGAGACLRRAGAPAGAGSRLVLAAAVLVVFLPAPPLVVLPLSVETLGAADGFGGAVSRAAALMLLATCLAWTRIDPALRRAALAAGATPLQAWRHAVLAPIWRPALLGGCAGYAAALTQTRAGLLVGGPVSLGEAWHLPAGLLLAAFGAAALRRAIR